MTCLSGVNDAMLLELVRGAVATVLELPLESLEASTRLVDDIEADSLAVIEIVEIIEEQLRAKGSQVWIDDQALARMKTLGDVVATVSAVVSAGRTGARL